MNFNWVESRLTLFYEVKAVQVDRPGYWFFFGGSGRVEIGRRVEEIGRWSTALSLVTIPQDGRLAQFQAVTRAINQRTHARSTVVHTTGRREYVMKRLQTWTLMDVRRLTCIYLSNEGVSWLTDAAGCWWRLVWPTATWCASAAIGNECWAPPLSRRYCK